MGLIKSAVSAAVFVKTAHVVHDRIERRQQAEWAAQGHPAPGGPPGAYPPPPHATGPGGPPGAYPVPYSAPYPAAHPAPAPAPAASPDDTSARLAHLAQLGELRAAGVLTEAEFEAQKARILNG